MDPIQNMVVRKTKMNSVFSCHVASTIPRTSFFKSILISKFVGDSTRSHLNPLIFFCVTSNVCFFICGDVVSVLMVSPL